MTIDYGRYDLPPAEDDRLTSDSLRVQELFAAGDAAAALELAERVWDEIPGESLEAKVMTAGVPQLVALSVIYGLGRARLEEPMAVWSERLLASYGYEDKATPLLEVGEAWYLLGDLDRATQAFTRVLKAEGKRAFRELDPNFLRLAEGEPLVEGSAAPAELDEDEVDRLAEVGNEALEAGDWQTAVEAWTEGLALVPEPKSLYEATMWFCASLADAYWTAGQYDLVVDFAQQAMDASDGGNGFVWLRLGQGQLELGQRDAAADSLMSAFMLEGHEIFEGEDPKYLQLLRDTGAKNI